jgi:hypothetical protein
MTPIVIQTCTWRRGRAFQEFGQEPCGEPVAERQTLLDWLDAPDTGEDWKLEWVHISLGPCETVWEWGDACGRESDSPHERAVTIDGIFTTESHPYAPTVTERTGVGHDAEWATPPVEEVEA